MRVGHHPERAVAPVGLRGTALGGLCSPRGGAAGGTGASLTKVKRINLFESKIDKKDQHVQVLSEMSTRPQALVLESLALAFSESAKAHTHAHARFAQEGKRRRQWLAGGEACAHL